MITTRAPDGANKQSMAAYIYILILFLIKGRFAIWRLEAEWKYKGPPCWSPTVQDSRSATAVPSFQPRLLPLLKNQDLAHSEIQPVLFFSWGIQCMFTTALLTFLHSGFQSIELDYFALFANLQYHIRLPQINQKYQQKSEISTEPAWSDSPL